VIVVVGNLLFDPSFLAKDSFDDCFLDLDDFFPRSFDRYTSSSSTSEVSSLSITARLHNTLLITATIQYPLLYMSLSFNNNKYAHKMVEVFGSTGNKSTTYLNKIGLFCHNYTTEWFREISQSCCSKAASKMQNHVMHNAEQHNNDRLTAFDPGQPG